MNLGDIIKSIGDRFRAPKRHKERENGAISQAIQNVGSKFSNFLSSQTQKVPQISQQTWDTASKEVGDRWNSFSKQPEFSELEQKFNNFKRFSEDYNPGSQDLNAPINKDIPVLSPVRKFFIEQNQNDPAAQAYQKTQRAWRTKEQITPEEEKLATEYMVNSFGGGHAGTVKKLAQPLIKEGTEQVLTKAQQIAKEKLPGILHQTYPDQKVARNQAARQQVQSIVDNTKHASEAWKKEFIGWVNTRTSAKFEGIIKKKEFTDLDGEGMAGILKFQAGDKSGRFGDVKKYFDGRYKELRQNNIDLGFRADYLPQLWASSDDELVRTFDRTLGLRPSFTLEAVLKNYQEGLEKGLTPRFKDISSLVGWYEQRTSKLLADKRFFDYLKREQYIKPSSSAPQWWRPISSSHFPAEKTKVGTETVVDTWSAEKDIADAIENYLKHPTGRLADFANFATRVKTMGLSAGVPFTSLNYHGASIFARSMLAANNPASQLVTNAKFFMSPRAAQDFVQTNLNKAVFYTKHGLTMDAEDYGLIIESLQQIERTGIMKYGNKVFTGIEHVFSDPLFKNTVPALKLNYADEVFKKLSQSMPEEQAAKLAAKSANDLFGGINTAQLFRKKETQNLMRSIFLAPDWLESTVRTGKGIGASILKPGSKEHTAYRVFARNFILSYVALNVMNKAMSGHFMVENEGNNKFFLDTGTYTNDGKKRYIKPYAGAVDMIRLPQEILSGLAKGDPTAIASTLNNRFSFPVAAGVHLLNNEDWRGRAIYGKDKYGNEIDPVQSAVGVANEVAGGFGMPSQARALVDLAGGRANLEETGAKILEVPIKYEGGAFSKTQQEKLAMYQAAGVSGEEIHEGLRSDKEETPGIFDSVLSFFGMGSSSTEKEISDPLVKAFNEEIEGDEKASRIRDIFKSGLDRAEIEKVLEKEGLGTYEEASVTIMKSLGVENGNRWKFIEEYTKEMEGEELEKTLYTLAEEGVLTTGVISQAVDDERLSEEQADYLRALIKTTKGTGGSGKGKAAPKLKSGGALPSIDIPTFAGKAQQAPAPSKPKAVAQAPAYQSAYRTALSRIKAPELNPKFKSYE